MSKKQKVSCMICLIRNIKNNFMSDLIKAPWPKELVEKLNQYQKCGSYHPYTCGYCRDRYGTTLVKNEKGDLIRASDDWFDWDLEKKKKEIIHNERALIATEKGWVCETCDNIQDWCLEPPKDLRPFIERYMSFYSSSLQDSNN